MTESRSLCTALEAAAMPHAKDKLAHLRCTKSLHYLAKMTAVERGQSLVDLLDVVLVPAITRFRKDHGLEDRSPTITPPTRTKSI
jgi:hypothetical protein